jgi:hypothetical protein
MNPEILIPSLALFGRPGHHPPVAENTKAQKVNDDGNPSDNLEPRPVKPQLEMQDSKIIKTWSCADFETPTPFHSSPLLSQPPSEDETERRDK